MLVISDSHASWSARQPLGDRERALGLLREVKDRPLRPGLSLQRLPPRLRHPSTTPSQPRRGWLAARRGIVMMLLRRWRRGRSSVSGVTVSLAASCGREEQILPSLMQPSSSPAVKQFLLAGRDKPPWGWWWCSAMQCRRRCNVLAPAVDEELLCTSGTNTDTASPLRPYLRAIGMPGSLYAKH